MLECRTDGTAGNPGTRAVYPCVFCEQPLVALLSCRCSSSGHHPGRPVLGLINIPRPCCAFPHFSILPDRVCVDFRFSQAVLYFPILLIARISWVLQSFLFVFDALPGAGVWATKGAETSRLNGSSLASKLEVNAGSRLFFFCWRGSWGTRTSLSVRP